jgi:hypothetical protein
MGLGTPVNGRCRRKTRHSASRSQTARSGGLLTFAASFSDDKVAPKAAVPPGWIEGAGPTETSRYSPQASAIA